jgi:hypothetical protein
MGVMPNIALKQLAPNVTRVTVGRITLWFSYETIVAFSMPDYTKPAVSANVWSNTTAKHLTSIDNGDKAGRLAHDVFTATLESVMRNAGL